MKKLSALMIVSTVLYSSHVSANSFPEVDTASVYPVSQVPTGQSNWLGVSLSPVPGALRDQLSQLIPRGQGVLVKNVSPSSPAAKAGIRENDVLLSYDDQKLYSPSQLSGLIKSDKSGREVSLQLVQKGQLKTVKVKLGKQQGVARPFVSPSQTPPSQVPTWQYPPRGYSPFGGVPPQMYKKPGKQSLAWDSFESVQVKTLPDGRYHAEISFKNNDNETKKFSFEGKREEIIEQINAQQELPVDKKTALLNALNMRSDDLFNQPFFQGNPFNSPFFRGNPFNDPFFQQNPFDESFFRRFNQFRSPLQLPAPQINDRQEEVY